MSIPQVEQNPDGLIIVRTATGTYVDTAANFALDYGEAAPTLSAGAIDRVYEPGIRHALTDGKTIVAGGPNPWVEGDRYIANIATALAAQAARPPPAPNPPPA